MSVAAPDVAHLHAKALPHAIVKAGTALARCHQAIHGPLFFGPIPPAPPGYRFHAPAHEFRVCYFSLSVEGAFAETFLRAVPVRSLSASWLSKYAVSTVAATRDLVLVDLHGAGLAKLGTTAEIATVTPYDVTWQWALALW